MKRYLKTFVFIVLTNQGLVFSQDSTGSVVVEPKLDLKTILNHQSLHEKNPSTAFWLGLGSTVIPVGTGALMATLGDMHSASSETRYYAGLILAASGIVLGSSMGNFYAKDYKRGVLGIAIRLGGMLITYQGLKRYGELKTGEGPEDEGLDQGEALPEIYLGLGIVAGAAIWNIVSAPTSAREYNKKHGLSFSPLYDPLSKTGGMSLTYRF